MQEKILTDKTLGKITLIRSPRSKRICIRILPLRGIRVSMPWRCSYEEGLAFLVKNKEKVLEMLIRIRKTTMNPEIEGLSEDEIEAKVEQMRKEARKTLAPRLRELAAKYGFMVDRIAVRHNRSNWGSCSSKGSINLNINLVRLPERLRDYVMLHELCHLKEMNHGKGFHALLDKLVSSEFGTEEVGKLRKEMDKELKSYILL